MEPSPIRRDTYRQITDKIIAAMESGPGEFVLPWRTTDGSVTLPSNALTGNRYHGINTITLWLEAQRAGYATALWGTYNQWAALGAQVRKGERSSLIVFYKSYTSTPDPNDEHDTGQRRVARASFVFNVSQVDGFVAPEPPPPLPPVQRLVRVDRFIKATGAIIEHGGDRAYYTPSLDRIQMPDKRSFIGETSFARREGYYSVLLHELVHWSGAKTRLDRNMAGRFGTEAYAAEELVAEIGSAFLCSDLGISNEPRPDHAQYIASWLKLLKSDPRAIFSAAARAAEAAAFIRSLSAPEQVKAPPIPLSLDA